MTRCVALVVGAGRGSRLGGDVPKQYRSVGGIPIIRRTFEAFLRHRGVDVIRPVIHPDDYDLFSDAISGLDVLPPVNGGSTRQDSVRLGLESLVDLSPDFVLIQDAARPLLDGAIIDRVLAALRDHHGAIPAVPVADTLKRVGADGRIGQTVARSGLWRAQTPQGFQFGSILTAHRATRGLDLTDDAAVAENAGLDVVVVEGSEDNMKVTTAGDLLRAERIVGIPEFRTGSGFDVHRFCAGDHVTLCGVRIPCDAGLEGHSDADVAFHALTDALLGAVGCGDIGQHFPPTEPRWRGADSAIFLAAARDRINAMSGSIVNIDVTIICQLPKIGPHRTAMTERLAEVLSIPATRINVKATTTEGLGFTGRGEGIAAQASATVRLFSPAET